MSLRKSQTAVRLAVWIAPSWMVEGLFLALQWNLWSMF